METETRTVSEPIEGRSRARAFLVWIVGTALGLAVFDLVSARSRWAKRGMLNMNHGSIEAIPGQSEAAPPIYGFFRPGFSRWGLIAIGVALVGAVLAYVASRRDRLGKAVLVAGGIAFLLTFAAAVAVEQGEGVRCYERGHPERAQGGCPEPTNGLSGGSRQRDAREVADRSLRGFVARYPKVVADLNIHSRTHPPGRLVAEALLRRIADDRIVLVVAAFAFWSALAVVPLWFLARRFTRDDRASKIAVLLFVSAPGPVMFTVVSHDARDGALYLAAMALLVYGGAYGEGRLPLAAAGGFVLGLTSFLTYGIAFPAATIAILALWSRPWREALKVLGAAAVGGVAALLLLRVTFGFDVFEAYLASDEVIGNPCPPGDVTGPCLNTNRPYLFWLFGAPAAWLTYAGVPIAALALRQLFVERSRYLVALLVPLVLFYLLPPTVTGLIPGEVERTIWWAYPIAAIAAGQAFTRWEAAAGRRLHLVVAVLVLVAGFQAITLEALYATLW